MKGFIITLLVCVFLVLLFTDTFRYVIAFFYPYRALIAFIGFVGLIWIIYSSLLPTPGESYK